MKLYATVSSERAMKGQGGNKYLAIEVLAEKLEGIPTRANVYRLMLANSDGKLHAELLDYRTGKLIVLTNGKHQHRWSENTGACLECGEYPANELEDETHTETREERKILEGELEEEIRG